MAPGASSTFAAAAVHFSPGARTAWHTHPHGQTIFVTEGVGLCQREGGPVEVIHPGDRVFFEPQENHWHGAAPDHFMTHLSITEAPSDDRPEADWGEHVTDDPTALLHELTADALARGERLEDLSVTRPSLEDVYLELTE